MPDSLEEPDFRRLVASARWGDDHAWRVLVEHWTPRLFAFLHSRCRDPELSEELVQDVFVKVAQRLADYDERGRFSSWIMLITINRLRDEMRRRSRHARPVENETLGALAGSTQADAEGGPAAEESRRALDGALRSLSDAERELLHLRHAVGLSFSDISELLREPRGTLLARHHRVLGKLRVVLAPHDPKNPQEPNGPADEEGGRA
ncbi:MAG: hypothetical protein CMJ28_06330 [Phycisphaerae bacterium]|nr:hypothetical protein [Phycisphaerae bacterium]